MILEDYLNNIQNGQKLVLAQGRSPFILMSNQDKKLISKEVFSRKEIFNLMSYVGLNSTALNGQNHFYNDGKKYQVKSLILSDNMQLEISLADTSLFTFSDLVLPGYVFDWAQSNKGLVFFYGSDSEAVRKFSLSFSKFRADQLKGSSLIFNDSDTIFAGRQEHQLMFSEDQSDYLNLKQETKKFDHISYYSEINSSDTKRVMKDVDQNTLVTAPFSWSDVSSVWGELREVFSNDRDMKFMLNNLIGFVGIKSVETQLGQYEYLFEAVPFLKSDTQFYKRNFDEQCAEIEKMKEQKGYSFNQSIQALLLKRRIILESAYEASPDPKELNSMLTQVGF